MLLALVGAIVFPFILLLLTSASPVDRVSLGPPTPAPKEDKAWLWGWAWGSQSTVSVVDCDPVVSFYSRPGTFGPEITTPILGYVIPLNSFTTHCTPNTSTVASHSNSGCPTLCITRHNSPTEPWIALVQRGQCEFVKKVREAQRLGARAVVVGGNDPAVSGFPDTLVNMYSPEGSSDIRIAATFIKFSDYTRLLSLIAASNTSHSGLRTLSLLITAEYSLWEWYSPIVTFIVILLLPSILTFATLLIHRMRAARAAQLERAPEAVVRSLPCRVWTGAGWEKHDERDDDDSCPSSPSPKSSSNPTCDEYPSTSHPPATTDQIDQPWFKNQVECAICLCEFAMGDRVRVLPCQHIFHLQEVDEWLIRRKKLCPICKADVTVPRSPPATCERTPGSRNAQISPTPSERTPLLASPASQRQS